MLKSLKVQCIFYLRIVCTYIIVGKPIKSAQRKFSGNRIKDCTMIFHLRKTMVHCGPKQFYSNNIGIFIIN